jgi:glutamate dehydrogenase (NAD(P)+)
MKIQKLRSSVQYDRMIGGRKYGMVFTTTFEYGVEASTAVHGERHEHSIGGARFVAVGSLEETAHLASAMTEKNALADVPADGQKTVIACGADVRASVDARRDILVDHASDVVRVHRGAIFGPDMNNPEAVMDASARAPGMLQYMTGLSRAMNGLDIDVNGYTAVGLDESFDASQGACQTEPKTFAVQGLGAVGAHAARRLARRGLRFVGFSNVLGSARYDAGFDAEQLFESWKKGSDAAAMKEAERQGGTVTGRANDLFGWPADVFVPAARTSCIVSGGELADVRSTENADAVDVSEFFATMRPKLVIEGANHPLSQEAEKYLAQGRAVVLPDVVVNCGGLIGCWIEWELRASGRNADESAGIEAQARIRRTVRRNVEERLARADDARAAVRRMLASRFGTAAAFD